MKKLISIILALTMCLAVLPAAFAQESTRKDELAELEKRAEAGDAEAMCALGIEILQMQKATDEDYDTDIPLAHEWFKKAAALEYPEAYFWLGYTCERGWLSPETAEDLDDLDAMMEKAVSYYQKGIELGSTKCMAALGSMYIYPVSVVPDEATAKSLLESAAALGDADAVASLGIMYYFGNSVVEQDYSKAAELYEKAVDMGNMGVLEMLADMYYAGEGVPQDMEKYTEYYERARKLKGEELEKQRQAQIYFRAQ